MRVEYIRLGLRKRNLSIRLRLRWDKSPWTCEQISKRLPIEQQVWHAQWANNEIYTLVEAGRSKFRGEWQTVYPAPGDLMFVPIGAGFAPLPGSANLDCTKDHIDLAFFYERGSNLYGPEGPAIGNIFATATSPEDVEEFGRVCSDLWFTGAVGEKLFIEAIEPAPRTK